MPRRSGAASKEGSDSDGPSPGGHKVTQLDGIAEASPEETLVCFASKLLPHLQVLIEWNDYRVRLSDVSHRPHQPSKDLFRVLAMEDLQWGQDCFEGGPVDRPAAGLLQKERCRLIGKTLAIPSS